ncbi:MAG: DUF3455 domain-containing protein [Burkholderiaceae bacterium]
MNRRSKLAQAPARALALAAAALLAACSGMPGAARPPAFDQATLPEAVRVPAGHKVALETVGVGEITYECRAKAAAMDAQEWVFVGPQADLNGRNGAKLGSYFGPPATWAAADGSTITGTQLAVAPNGAGNIPLQLVKANPASGAGAMMGISYVQRVATRGGTAPASACDKSGLGRKEIVKYQADYIFWKAS